MEHPTNALDNFYLQQEEPLRSCMYALRQLILDFHPDMTADWKYKMPFFMYRGKMFCYIWKDKKTNQPYIGLAKGKELNHPKLELGNRKLIPIYRIDAEKDIPVAEMYEIFQQAVDKYVTV